ncbi:hypothetical protein [Rubripirellula lacrimiformis]|nr:hypothetical protein [Rubripirellula lacrimiformis]
MIASALLAMMAIGMAGCRQTTGSASAGSLAPVGPLSPVSPGQSPSLGPFGGPTRVAPPPTGSFSQPNNGYLAPAPQASAALGSGAPTIPFNQTNPAMAPAAMNPSLANAAPIGSGVRPASWTETTSNIASGPALPNAPATAPTPPSNPRAGGMQVIDLTGAPSPPGYRPTAPVTYQAFPTNGYQTGNPPVAGYPSPQQYQPGVNPGANAAWQSTTPAMAANPYVAPSNLPPSNPQSFNTADYANQQAYGNQPAQVAATSLTPLPQSVAAGAVPIRNQSNFQTNTSVPVSSGPVSSGPSTNPTPASSNDNLLWRRPGTQY